jgi:hypothetical protein
MDTAEGQMMNVPGGGAAAIYGPDGRQLSNNLPGMEEGLVVTDVKVDGVLQTRFFADPCGHYGRPVLLWLGVDSEKKRHVRSVGKE